MSKYYLALFNEETWNEFVENGASVYGTTLNRKSRMESTSPGDFLICYVTKLSRFVGLLKITSKSYLDDTRIWESDVYPVRVSVSTVYILSPENGIPVLDLKEELTIFGNLKNLKKWGAFFRNPLKSIQEQDAKIIVENIKKVLNK